LICLAFFVPASIAQEKGAPEIFLQLGHSSFVLSIAFSPDGRSLASGSDDGTIKLWDVAEGKVSLQLISLPGNEWLAFRLDRTVYNASLQGDEYAALRFGPVLRPVYPLTYYRDELQRDNLSQAFTEADPEISEKWIRLTWDQAENKGL
jgi:WD40 repeat protein